ncbi:bifunctional 2',3'-cyclic-nucleotide 2'-phosphodiesterase/3'-nucleotidase [Massilia solisilvae]|uniref:Bifunctional 2',3'-cyclic-nucleotide 2'-phosphodiesterase/3'-nucleotidase n=1 Tax=Massilia solisilvae TaxID=1811225 RepID=A0ABT2BMK8_9BURK|nr:bifunctional 2',3'-cyclic-nucleotide 2'-phosphodiesterase/3'-nucleotidase [Massilia solisilvae]MCS0609697.1 bifunctional 2',3'-cyclic-nucleotide 2'-phosphodiesterase/3'-nucleotidase [Massilia solisilvae]
MRACLRYQICIGLVPILVSGGALAAPRAPAGATATLAVLETTDIHANVVGYDYYKLAADSSLGLDRTATLIAQARREFANTLLLDNGDTIQGNALGDYQALAHPLRCDERLAIYKAMNRLGFEGGGVGNHDFNYGLPYLAQVTGSRFDVDGVDKTKRCAGPAFPIVLANVVSARTDKPLFQPYRIIDKRIAAVDAHGKQVTATVKVGIIGLTTPGILAWDKRWLEGKVYTEGVREAAAKYIPEMRAKGAELVVAISHGGIDGAAYSPNMENAGYYLAQVPGIDAMLLGHAHAVFPDAASRAPQFNLPGIDKAKGTVFGVPTVMASLWGKHLGVIGLHLRHDGKRWVVDKEHTTVEVRATQKADKSYVAPDPSIMELVAREHAGTIDYVKTPIGETDFRMSTYFADVGDVSAIQVVNDAQADYVRKYIAANLPQYANLPVLSMAAPFKAGAAGPADYTDVQPGKLALNNAADLYLYPNTLAAVKISGAQLKAWLEKSANRFNTIDPTRSQAQELVNPGFASYNFDMVTSKDLSYEIDVTRQPGSRIRSLSWQGEPVGDAQEFIVATNSYRASGGGGFAGLDGSATVLAAPDTNRDVLIAYIRKTGELKRATQASQRSWHFTPVQTAGPVVIRAAPGLLRLAQDAGLSNLRSLDADGKGFELYSVDLSK